MKKVLHSSGGNGGGKVGRKKPPNINGKNGKPIVLPQMPFDEAVKTILATPPTHKPQTKK